MRSAAWTLLAAAGASAGIAGCRPAKPTAGPEAAGSALDYAAPPEVKRAAAGAPGMIQFSGTSRPGALIRLASPDGSAVGATASSAGAWTLSAQTGGEPRLLSLSEDFGGRPLRARGYLLAVPYPAGEAAMLRPGAATAPLRPLHRLEISAVDFDAAGAAVVSGGAKPGETVHLLLDGADAGDDRADSKGAFAVSVAEPLRPGPHLLAAVTPEGRSETSFQAGPAAPIAQPPFAAARAGAAWRVDWMTPGGGVQTTLLFDPPGTRS